VANNPWDRVTVVLVTYNSEQVIEGVVASLADAPSVILVDNASDDETVSIAKRTRPDIECLVNTTNRGLGAAVNQGFARATTDFGLLLNPDARISTDGLAALVSAADANEKAGIVAPLLENSAGRLELSLMGPFEHTHHAVHTVPEGPFCTWFTTGAVWLAKMDVWRHIDGFDEAIFLYNDDADLCLRLCGAGFHLLVVPEVRGIHEGGLSVPDTPYVRWLKDWHQTWSHLFLLNRHGSRDAATRQGRRLLWRHGAKTMLYVLLLRPKKVRGNLAKASAAWAFLRGRPSH